MTCSCNFNLRFVFAISGVPTVPIVGAAGAEARVVAEVK